MHKDTTQSPHPDTAKDRVSSTCNALARLLGRLEAIELLQTAAPNTQTLCKSSNKDRSDDH